MTAFTVDIRRKSYGSGEAARLAIAGVWFEVREGELVCELGPSGSGKTTTLNIIAGLDTEFEGKVTFGAGKRRLSYVFQDPRLLPWRTLLENTALPLKDRPHAISVAARWLDRVGLPGCHDLYPGQCSLGMQRRAALARAFAFGPSILLMDEPFVSLDEKAGAELRSLFLDLWRTERVTTLFVTHSVAEAAQLATRVLIFSASPAKIAANVEMPAKDGSHEPPDAEHALRLALDRVAQSF